MTCHLGHLRLFPSPVVPRCPPPRIRAPREACAPLPVAMFDCNLCQREALFTLDSSTSGSTTLPRATGSIRVVGTMGHAPWEELTSLDWMDGDVSAGRLKSSPAVVLVSTDLRSRAGHICLLSHSLFHSIFYLYSSRLSLPALLQKLYALPPN
jgi:hypothetical protein